MNHENLNVVMEMPSGPGWTFWAILFSALIATVAIATNRVIAKRRAAIDLVVMTETDEFVTRRSNLMNLIKDEKIMTVLAPDRPEVFDARRSVSHVLNQYELIAIAVLERSADEQILKMYLRSNFVATWEGCHKLIEAINSEQKPTAYEHLSKLAKRWKDHPGVETSTCQRIKSVLNELVPW